MLLSLNILDTFALQSISLAFLSFGELTACRVSNVKQGCLMLRQHQLPDLASIKS